MPLTATDEIDIESPGADETELRAALTALVGWAASGDRTKFSLEYVEGSIPSGGSLKLQNYVFGYNLTANGGHADTTKTAMGLVFQQNFAPNSGGGINDAFVLLTYPDSVASAKAPWTFEVPQDPADAAYSNEKHESQTVAWNSYASVPKVEFNWNTGEEKIALYSGITIKKTTNNQAFIKQMNAAANAYVDLMYLDGDDRIRHSGPTVFVGVTPTGGTYPNTFCVVQPTSLAANGVVLDVVCPSVTGSYTAWKAGGSATVDFILGHYNNSNTSTANAIVEIRTIGASAGDPKIYLNVNGGTRWQFGVDNDQSDRLAWNTTTLGSSDKMTLDTSGNLTLDGYIKPKSYTVATVPSASSAGAGAMIYVSDESGGAVLAFSNGTNWLRVTDRATIS